MKSWRFSGFGFEIKIYFCLVEFKNFTCNHSYYKTHIKKIRDFSFWIEKVKGKCYFRIYLAMNENILIEVYTLYWRKAVNKCGGKFLCSFIIPTSEIRFREKFAPPTFTSIFKNSASGCIFLNLVIVFTNFNGLVVSDRVRVIYLTILIFNKIPTLLKCFLVF